MRIQTSLRGALMGTTLLGAVATATPAAAALLTVDGITFNTGALVFSIGTVFEDIVPAIGMPLDGIGEVTTIFAADNTTHTWDTGDNGRELTYRFDGFVLEGVILNIFGGFDLIWSGGAATFYSDSTPDFSASSGGGQAADILSATDGNTWLSFAAATALICPAGDMDPFTAGAQTCFSGAATPITLTSTIAGTLATVVSGSGVVFLDVTGGLAAVNFDTNVIPITPSPGFSDFKANFSFDTLSATGTNWDLSGSLDARSFAIPEPASLGLLGIGLFGLGALYRRRKA